MALRTTCLPASKTEQRPGGDRAMDLTPPGRETAYAGLGIP